MQLLSRRRRPLIQPGPPILTVPIAFRVSRSPAAQAMRALAVGCFRRIGLSLEPPPPDFIAAVIAALQQNTACAQAFGDVPLSTPKFHGVQAFKAAIPYARILELPANDTFQSLGSDGLSDYFERGELQLDIFASSESSARSLGKLVAAVLNDAPLLFADGTLLELRQSRSFFTPEPDPGPGIAVVYHRVILFLYVIQRNL